MRREVKALYDYDRDLFLKYSGAVNLQSQEAMKARIIMAYHVIEKGLTMPRRRKDFGRPMVLSLIQMLEDWKRQYGSEDEQIRYAGGVVLAYKEMHIEVGEDMSDSEFWRKVNLFEDNWESKEISLQRRYTKDTFFEGATASFAKFAHSRHTCRHFIGEVPLEILQAAVELAMTTPSACNRQHSRVHCVSDHQTRDAIYDIQKGKGNRGFGEDADKLLVITAELQDLRWIEERNDVFVNGGMFLMNLSYALYYYKIAHCILNWSVTIDADKTIHRLLSIPESERVIAMIACGNAPDEFYVANSPRKSWRTVFTNH
ncbi:MAG: nitroreductase family protein [Kiritimatiellae bacterium]|nr:nitroreductase family protein [Kiritimatiellia bacterium]